MKELTGVFLTDGVSRSGERFTVPALEDMLWLSYRKGNPSKYIDAERGLRNWVKQQKKLMNAGALEGQRLMMFNELLGLGEMYKRVNQWG